MPLPAHDLEARLQAAFPDAQIVIDDLAGDGDHYRARIVSAAFAGLSRIKQHQMVYAALGGIVGGELHALALETSAAPTPAH
jgi:stress-induced morphogen